MSWTDTWVPFALLGVALLLVLILLALVVSAALRDGGKAGSNAAAKTLRLLGAESLRLSFRRAVKLVETNLASASERYSLSWTLLLNDSTEQDVPLAASGLPSAFSTDSSMAVAAQGIGWHFFDKGLVVQLRTSHLGPAADKASVGGGIWDEFLTLCRNYRPERPFDAIVLAIPAAALLDIGAEGEATLRARAQGLHRRLWLAQNRLALRFPIHLVVTECEAIPGFARFGAALPDALRRAILGWASPYELVTPYQPQWVDAALDQVVGAVADSCAELGALVPADADSIAYFLLPAELERLRAGLKLFCEELMRPSAYHESFLLRGIYLTGDSSPAAVLGASTADTGGALELFDAREPMPVFLRDIFERKVFAEVGLVRSSRQRMRRPAARRLGYWLALLVPLVWAVGLVFDTWRLNGLQSDIVAALKPGDTLAASSGNGPGLAPNQRQAAAAMQHAEHLAQLRFYAISMPGSWPLLNRAFDEKLHELLEVHFAENAVAVLNEAAMARIAQLTGANYAPGESRLRESISCRKPRDWPNPTKSAGAAGLNMKKLEEYKALIIFLGKLDDTNQAIQALARLADAGDLPPQGEDLVQAMRILLKLDLTSQSDSTAALYRAAAQRKRKLDVAWMGYAARCTVNKAGEALYTRLFDNNTLMVEEKNIQDSMATLRHASGRGNDYVAQLAPWQKLHLALQTQEALLLPGEGEWMHLEDMTLGREQDILLKRIRADALLGDIAARDIDQQARTSHAKFQNDHHTTIAESGMMETGVGDLDWTEKGWTFTPRRRALADAVTAMLAPPWMAPAAVAPLAAIDGNRTAQWDVAQLERATMLGDARSGFQAGAFQHLPTDLQTAAGVLVDAALAAASANAVAQALTAGPQELPSAASDAQRAAAVRVRAWLARLGANTLAGEIDKVLVQDAATRLKYLDMYLFAAQLYLPGDTAFDQWQGQKGAMVDVFGGGDVAGLHAYIEKQQSFIDISVAQAEGVVNTLVSIGVPSGMAETVRRWQALQGDARRYQLKSPLSSRLALENFILTGSADIDVQNCTGKQVQRRGTGGADDLFAERLQALRTQLKERCLALAGGSEQRQWQQFADAWNRDLAPRAPFNVAPDGKPGEPADRGAIGALLKLYDGAPAYRTNLQVRRIRALLAPLYPLDAAQAGGLDVAVDFRANPGFELRANQIIDWKLTIGRASLRQLDAARPLRWEPGMPVTLSLRLAQDGGWRPKRDPGQAAMSVDGRTVNFGFDDPWALLSFINTYREAEAAGDDGRAPLLAFNFGLTPASDKANAAAGALDVPARVFLRLRVSAPGKLEALAWPARQPLGVPSALPPLQELVQGAL